MVVQSKTTTLHQIFQKIMLHSEVLFSKFHTCRRLCSGVTIFSTNGLTALARVHFIYSKPRSSCANFLRAGVLACRIGMSRACVPLRVRDLKQHILHYNKNGTTMIVFPCSYGQHFTENLRALNNLRRNY